MGSIPAPASLAVNVSGALNFAMFDLRTHASGGGGGDIEILALYQPFFCGIEVGYYALLGRNGTITLRLLPLLFSAGYTFYFPFAFKAFDSRYHTRLSVSPALYMGISYVNFVDKNSNSSYYYYNYSRNEVGGDSKSGRFTAKTGLKLGLDISSNSTVFLGYDLASIFGFNNQKYYFSLINLGYQYTF